MYTETINTIIQSAKQKVALFRNNKSGYFIHSAMAGIYVGFGIVLVLLVGSPLFSSQSPFMFLVMGLSFGIALSLVLFAGSDLFTGNTMILPLGAIQEAISWKDVFKLCLFNYLGNFAGSILLAGIIAQADIFKDAHSKAFLTFMASKKMGMNFWVLFLRGILCNWLVVLSVWCFYRMKTESGKLVMIFWCLFCFIASGFEHSVANMTLLTLANFIVPSEIITWSSLTYNLFFVTLGNIISGGLFMSSAYWWISRKGAKEG